MSMESHKFPGSEFGNHPVGACAFSWKKSTKAPHEMFAAFAVMVESGAVKRIYDPVPDIQMKVRLLPIGNVGVVIVLVRFAGFHHTFALHVNHYSDVYRSPLHDWSTSQVFTVIFCEPKIGRVATYDFSGDLASSFAPPLSIVESMPLWSEDDFNRAVSVIKSSPDKLWDTGKQG